MGTAKAKPKFKVGDRVRLVKDGRSTTGAIGKTATLVAYDGGDFVDNGEYLLDIDPPFDFKTLAVTPNFTRAKPDCFELIPATLTIEAGRYYKTRDGRKVGPMKFEMNCWFGKLDGLDKAYRSDGKHGNFCIANQANQDLIAEWVEPKVDPGPVAIVAVIENGQPKPANCPIVHPTRDAAVAEATRLATKHLGQEFGVFELVSTCKNERQFDHEWQRLAVNGKKISAIKEIRRITGFGLKSSKDGLEDWLSRNAA